jgi:hypothetical protein
MNVWFDLADAVITVYTVENAFEDSETKDILTQIPFSQGVNESTASFRKSVFEAFDLLSKTYSTFDHVHITLDVKFMDKYVNA